MSDKRDLFAAYKELNDSIKGSEDVKSDLLNKMKLQQKNNPPLLFAVINEHKKAFVSACACLLIMICAAAVSPALFENNDLTAPFLPGNEKSVVTPDEKPTEKGKTKAKKPKKKGSSDETPSGYKYYYKYGNKGGSKNSPSNPAEENNEQNPDEENTEESTVPEETERSKKNIAGAGTDGFTNKAPEVEDKITSSSFYEGDASPQSAITLNENGEYKKGGTFIYSFYLKADEPIEDLSLSISYDSSALKVIECHSPSLGSACKLSVGQDHIAVNTVTSKSGYDFSSYSILVSVKFQVEDSVHTSIASDISDIVSVSGDDFVTGGTVNRHFAAKSAATDYKEP